MRPQIVLRGVIGGGDVAGEWTAIGCGGLPNFSSASLIQIDVGPEADRIAADDRQGQRQSVARGRITDSGLPPTPTQVRSVPLSIGG